MKLSGTSAPRVPPCCLMTLRSIDLNTEVEEGERMICAVHKYCPGVVLTGTIWEAKDEPVATNYSTRVH